MKKYIYLIVIVLAGIFVGNQLFNHVNVWLGIAVILASIAILFYKLNSWKNENID